MKRQFIITAAILLGMTGCEYNFPLDNIVEEPMLCIRAYMPAGDSTYIRLNKTVPVTKIGQVDTAMISPSYSIKCNGTEIQESCVFSENGSLMIKTGGFRSGDLLEITARTDGTETASASTTVPEPFPDYTIETFKDEKGESRARIKIKEMPESGNFYGAAIDYRAVIKEDARERVVEDNVSVMYNDEEIPLDYNGYYPYYIYRDGRDVVLWSENDMTDGEYEIIMDFQMNPGRTGNIIERSIRVHLLRFSEEMYRTLYAEAAMDNFLVSLGFSSPSFTYNSITDGVGYFGAYSYTCSGSVTETYREQ